MATRVGDSSGDSSPSIVSVSPISSSVDVALLIRHSVAAVEQEIATIEVFGVARKAEDEQVGDLRRCPHLFRSGLAQHYVLDDLPFRNPAFAGRIFDLVDHQRCEDVPSTDRKATQCPLTLSRNRPGQSSQAVFGDNICWLVFGRVVAVDRGHIPYRSDAIVGRANVWYCCLRNVVIDREQQRDEPDEKRLEELEGRSGALKWILVACFGYQGFSNAKFGQIECQEAINACAREILLTAKQQLEAGG